MARIPAALQLADIQRAFADINKRVDTLLEDKRVDFKGRRITGAGDATSGGDYVTFRQLQGVLDDVTRSIGTNVPTPYFGGPTYTGLSLSEGISLLAARADHVHAIKVFPKDGLTEGADNGILNIPITQGQSSGGAIVYLVHASDGTDLQTEAGILVYAINNKAGAEVASLIKLAMAEYQTLGTLDVEFTYTAGTDAVTINVKPTSSLTQTALWIRFHPLHVGAETPTAV